MPGSSYNYGWPIPTVGGDSGLWGGELNTMIADVDAQMFTVQGVANAALPANRVTGGTSGRLDTTTETLQYGTNTTASGAITISLVTANYWVLTLTGNVTGITVTLPTGSLPAHYATVLLLRISNSGTYTITWPTNFKFPSGVKPTLTPQSSGGADLIGFIYDNASGNFYMAGLQQNVQ